MGRPKGRHFGGLQADRNGGAGAEPPLPLTFGLVPTPPHRSHTIGPHFDVGEQHFKKDCTTKTKHAKGTFGFLSYFVQNAFPNNFRQIPNQLRQSSFELLNSCDFPTMPTGSSDSLTKFRRSHTSCERKRAQRAADSKATVY